MNLAYTLSIESPDGFDVEGHENYDSDTLDAIEHDREPHDVTMEAAVLRWLGGTVNEAETVIGEQLPDGWSCKVEERG